jgi:hypothetical protein
MWVTGITISPVVIADAPAFTGISLLQSPP